MARQFSLPANLKIVQLTPPVTTNGGVTSGAVTLKGANKAWVVIELQQAAAHATVLSLKQATSVAASTNKAGPSATQVWANEDAAATDTLVKQANANSYTVVSAIKKKQVVFEIDPSELDVAGGYDCIYVTASDSSQATNFISATAYLDTSFKQATPPSAIID